MQGTRQIKQIVGSNIRARREELGWSRRKLGLEAGVDPMSLYKWESGRHRPHDLSLAAIAHALDRDLAWFYTDHDPEPSHAERAANATFVARERRAA